MEITDHKAKERNTGKLQTHGEHRNNHPALNCSDLPVPAAPRSCSLRALSLQPLQAAQLLRVPQHLPKSNCLASSYGSCEEGAWKRSLSSEAPDQETFHPLEDCRRETRDGAYGAQLCSPCSPCPTPLAPGLRRDTKSPRHATMRPLQIKTRSRSNRSTLQHCSTCKTDAVNSPRLVFAACESGSCTLT